MDTPSIREVERKFNLWGGYRDELVATAMTLSLVVFGSFILTERMIGGTAPLTETASPLPPNQTQTLGISDTAPTPVTQINSVAKTSTASEGAVVYTEVPYGQDGDYDFSEYTISFRNPRIVFDAKTNSRRKLLVNVWIKNKMVVEGIDSKLMASIIKDGVVIVPNAAMYIPSSRLLGVNEEGMFEASINLIEGTDVRELKYTPSENLPKASHFLP
jgi:hypothetical protein